MRGGAKTLDLQLYEMKKGVMEEVREGEEEEELEETKELGERRVWWCRGGSGGVELHLVAWWCFGMRRSGMRRSGLIERQIYN